MKLVVQFGIHNHIDIRIMRDRNIVSENYFNKFIESHKKRIEESLNRINSCELPEENIPLVKNRIFFRSLEVLIAMYSNGTPIENLHKEFTTSVLYMEDSWDDSVVKFKMGRPTKIFDYYTVNHYCYMLWMLSFAVLLDVPKSEYTVLRNLIERGNINDRLLLYFLSYLTKEHFPDTSVQKYEPFKRIYKKGSLETIDIKQVKSYLNNWYLNTNYLTWHKSLKSIDMEKFSYFGYWSFESAAIVAIKGLDDSSFRNNEYYPKDLVDYYRSQHGKDCV